MNIVVFGGTGLIGKEFCFYAMLNGHLPIVVSRNPKKHSLPYKVLAYSDIVLVSIQRFLSEPYYVVNLSGANIANQRWTSARKKVLEDSRIDIIDRIELFLKQAPQEPKAFLQASAVGYYGDTGDEIVKEDRGVGANFLANLAHKWETRFLKTSLDNTRKVIMRTGVVLSEKGGFFPRILRPFKMFMGGVIGSGNQYISWIHMQDLVRAMVYVLEDEQAYGAYNFTAPNPVSMRKFASELGKALHKPSFWIIPSFVMKMLYGQMAQETMLEGTRVVPDKLINHEFEFVFLDLSQALKGVLKRIS